MGGIAVILWYAAVFGTCAYVVFWRDASGWWFLLAFLIAGCISYGRQE